MMKDNVRNNGFRFFICNEIPNDIPMGNKRGTKSYFLENEFFKN